MGIKETLIKLGEMPKEPHISIEGNRLLCVEECRCITACDEDLAVLRVKGFDIRVVGSGLVLESYGAFGVRLTGSIHSLTFDECAEV